MKMKRICVFTKYKDTESWNRDTKRKIFKEGKIVWECYDIMSGKDDEGDTWDEIMIMEYSDEKNYNQALEDLKEESKIEKYQAYLFEPYPKEQQEKVDMMMKKAKDDSYVDITPGGTVDELLPNRIKSNEFLKKFLNGEYQGDIVVVNFIKHPEISVYENGHKAEGETGKQTYKNYGRAAMKVQGKVGAHYDAAGKVKATIVSDLDFKWDVYVFVHYPSVKAFEQFYLAKTRWPTVTHQQASMEDGMSFFVKPYEG